MPKSYVVVLPVSIAAGFVTPQTYTGPVAVCGLVVSVRTSDYNEAAAVKVLGWGILHSAAPLTCIVHIPLDYDNDSGMERVGAVSSRL